VGDSLFTGIIEEIGKVLAVQQGQQSLKLTIEASVVLSDVHIGDSIAVNGVCLTVTSFTQSTFDVDVMPETFHHTSLKWLKKGSPVNLERAMHAQGRFGGHFVSGHVDATGTIKRKKAVDNALYVTIDIPSSLQPLMMEKGSVAIDGTSLTIFDVKTGEITVSLIPHTQEMTVLAKKSVGDIVNIEGDMLAKYVQHMLQRSVTKKETITMEFLQKNGFLS
jgi:riboflavin synthase